MSSIGESGISACTAVASARPIALVVDTTMRPALSSRCDDLAEAAHQLGLRGVDPEVVVDAEQHVLAVEHVDAAPRLEQRPLERARVVGACPVPALPTNITSAARWPWRWVRSAAVTPPSTQLKSRVRRLGAQVAQLVGDRGGDDAAARHVVAVDDHEAPGRLAVGRQVERHRLPQLEDHVGDVVAADVVLVERVIELAGVDHLVDLAGAAPATAAVPSLSL